MNGTNLAKLRQDFDSDSPTVRKEAINTLAKLEEPDVIKELLSAQEHPNLDVRVWAAEALAQKGDIRALKGLLYGLDSSDQELVYAAGHSLEHLWKTLAPKAHHMDEAIVDMAEMVGADLVPSLIEIVSSGKEAWLRTACVVALGQIGDEVAIPALVKTMHDRVLFSYDIASQAAEAMRRIGKPAVQPLIDVMTTSEDANARLNAIGQLGLMGDQRAVPSLMEALNEEDPHFRQVATLSLGLLQTEIAIPAIAQLLQDPEDGVRKQAELSLKWIGTPEAWRIVKAFNQNKG